MAKETPTDRHRAEVHHIIATLDGIKGGVLKDRDKVSLLTTRATQHMGSTSQEARDMQALLNLAHQRLDEAAGFLQLARVPAIGILDKIGYPGP